MKPTGRHSGGRGKNAPCCRYIVAIWETCPNAGYRFGRKGDKCPVWVEGVDPQGAYHRGSLRTGSWDLGERLMREMMLPTAAEPLPDAARPETAPPMSLESAMSTFIATSKEKIACRTRSESIGSCFVSFRDSPIGIEWPLLRN